MDNENKANSQDKTNTKNKKKMDFTRFSNLLYEASSSLVPGTGELYSTQYTGDAATLKKEEENIKG